MDTVRDILDENPSGISRAGMLAWARLRIDPAFSEDRLEQELQALGPAVVERYGFLWPAGSPAAPSDAIPVGVDTTVSTAATPLPMPPETTGAGTVDHGTPPTDEGGSAADLPEPGDSLMRRSIGAIADGLTGGDAFDDALAAVEPDDASVWRGSAVLGTDTRDWIETGGIGLREPAPGAIPGWRAPDTAVTGRRRSVIGTVAGVALFVAFLASDLLGGGGSEPSSTPAPTTVAPGATVTGTTGSIEDLEVGDCIAIPTADTFDQLLYIPCTAPHEAEVFFVGPMPTGSFPGPSGFQAFAEATCGSAFRDFTGSDVDSQTVLDFGWFMPTEQGWAAGDRRVDCYLLLASGGLSSVSWRGGKP